MKFGITMAAAMLFALPSFAEAGNCPSSCYRSNSCYTYNSCRTYYRCQPSRIIYHQPRVISSRVIQSRPVVRPNCKNGICFPPAGSTETVKSNTVVRESAPAPVRESVAGPVSESVNAVKVAPAPASEPAEVNINEAPAPVR